MPPPYRIPTDLVRVEGSPLEPLTVTPLIDGVTSPLLGVSLLPTGVDGLSAFDSNPLFAEPAVVSNANGSSPGIFRSFDDFMTGGNRHHNAEADYLVREIVRRVEAVRQQSVDPSVVREWVHQELVHFKDNGGDQYNGNVSRSDWAEVIDHGVDRFAGRSRRVSARTVESSEAMHWRIEELIETEMMRSENAALLSDPNLETLRATLRTRLRAEFSGMLMNEWGSERLEDISDFLRDGIVVDFEGRARAIVADGISASSVCTMADPVPAPPPPTVVPSAWSEVVSRPLSSTAIRNALNSVDPLLAEYFDREISNAASPITTMSDLLARVSDLDPAILDQAAAAATAEGRPLTEMSERGIFELITRSAVSHGNWSLSDPTRFADMSGRFERSLRASGSPSDRPGSVEMREREERERREAERRVETRGRP